MTTPPSTTDAHRRQRPRRIAAAAVCVLACIGILASVVVTWAHESVLRTDAYVGLMTRVMADPDVIDRTSRTVVRAATEGLDVEGNLGRALPADSTFLARPLTVALEQALTDQVAAVMRGEDFRRIWGDANRVVHEQTLLVLRGGTDVLTVNAGTVTLNLFPLIDEVLHQLQASGYIPPEVSLPDLRAPETPATLRRDLEQAFAIRLPADYGTVRLLRSAWLGRLQTMVQVADLAMVLVWLATILLVGLSLWLAVDRLRMVMWLALGTVIAMALGRLLLQTASGSVDDLFPDPTIGSMVGPIVDAVLDDLFGLMTIVAASAVLVALGAFLAGQVRRHPDAMAGLVTAGPPASLVDRLRTATLTHAAALRWAGVAVVGFVVLWRVAGLDIALVAAIGLGGWLALIRWLSRPVARPADVATGTPTGASSSP